MDGIDRERPSGYATIAPESADDSLSSAGKRAAEPGFAWGAEWIVDSVDEAEADYEEIVVNSPRTSSPEKTGGCDALSPYYLYHSLLDFVGTASRDGSWLFLFAEGRPNQSRKLLIGQGWLAVSPHLLHLCLKGIQSRKRKLTRQKEEEARDGRECQRTPNRFSLNGEP